MTNQTRELLEAGWYIGKAGDERLLWVNGNDPSQNTPFIEVAYDAMKNGWRGWNPVANEDGGGFSAKRSFPVMVVL